MSRDLPTAATAAEEGEYDCVACGACCVVDGKDSAYVYVDSEDLLRLSPEQKKLVQEEYDPEMRATLSSIKAGIDEEGNCRCVALSGKIGERVSCTIYESRPQVCRLFAMGSDDCLVARRSKLGIS